MARCTSWPEHAVEISLAVELAPLGEAGPVQQILAYGTLEAVLMEGHVPHSDHKFVHNNLLTFATLRHRESSNVRSSVEIV